MENSESYVINDSRTALVLTNSLVSDLKDPKRKIFNIILLSTNEVVGIIGYDFEMNNEVMYNVYPNYSNNHYATDALALLKKLIWQLHKEASPDLYIVALNKASEKVALNNGGIMIASKCSKHSECVNSFKAKHYKIRVKLE